MAGCGLTWKFDVEGRTGIGEVRCVRRGRKQGGAAVLHRGGAASVGWGMATRVRSFSKVNLGLRIGPARADGFHGLATVYQTLALHDMVTVSARRMGTGVGGGRVGSGGGAATGSRITIRTDHPRVPTDARNTVWKMVERALEAMEVVAEVEVRIEKRLPVQGGLGAGSANAAAALIGLERELGLAAGAVVSGHGGRVLSGAERLRLAAEVGSDVPLFLLGGSVLGLGRGEQVVALPELAGVGGDGRPVGMPCVVAVPRVGVSTPVAFREWDRRQAVREGKDAGVAGDRLTPTAGLDTLTKLSLSCSSSFARESVHVGVAGGLQATGIDRFSHPAGFSGPHVGGESVDLAESALLSLVHAGIENDFEDVVFGFHPSLREIKQELLGAATDRPAVYAALSGSGSALFGLYRTIEDARAAQQRVGSHAAEAILTATLPREGFWATMIAHGAGASV